MEPLAVRLLAEDIDDAADMADITDEALMEDIADDMLESPLLMEDAMPLLIEPLMLATDDAVLELEDDAGWSVMPSAPMSV